MEKSPSGHTSSNAAFYIPSSTHFTTLKLLHSHPYHFPLHTHIPSVHSEKQLIPTSPTDRCMSRDGCFPRRNSCHPPLSSLPTRCFFPLPTSSHHEEPTAHGASPVNICRDTPDVPALAKESRQAQIPHVFCTQVQIGRSCFDPIPATIQH